MNLGAVVLGFRYGGYSGHHRYHLPYIKHQYIRGGSGFVGTPNVVPFREEPQQGIARCRFGCVAQDDSLGVCRVGERFMDLLFWIEGIRFCFVYGVRHM